MREEILYSELEENGLGECIPHFENGEYDPMGERSARYEWNREISIRKKMAPEAKWEEDDDEICRIYNNIDKKQEFIEDTGYRFNSLEEMKIAFDYDDLDDDEFLNLHIGDLLGLSKGQMAFVDLYAMKPEKLVEFKERLWDRRLITEIPSIEQRIKYAQVACLVNIDKLEAAYEILSGLEELDNNARSFVTYIRSIIVKNSIERSVQVLDLLRDYYTLLQFASEINQKKGNAFAYDLCPKPSKLKDLHSKAERDAKEYMIIHGNAGKEEINKGIAMVASSRDYRSLLYSGSEYQIIGCINLKSLEKEANELDHCVETYAGTFAAGYTYILYLRKKDDLCCPYFTLEVKRDSRGYALVQCYGRKNTTRKPTACKNFILQWAKVKHIQIKCEI